MKLAIYAAAALATALTFAPAAFSADLVHVEDGTLFGPHNMQSKSVPDSFLDACWIFSTDLIGAVEDQLNEKPSQRELTRIRQVRADTLGFCTALMEETATPEEGTE